MPCSVAEPASYAPRTKRALAGLKTGISGDQTSLDPPRDFLDLARFSSNQFPINETKGTTAAAGLLNVEHFTGAGPIHGAGAFCFWSFPVCVISVTHREPSK